MHDRETLSAKTMIIKPVKIKKKDFSKDILRYLDVKKMNNGISISIFRPNSTGSILTT